jgi:hypothetical protein
MTSVRDWRIELIEAHPRLFRAPKGPERPDGYAWCEAGWRDLLERMCARIESALRNGDTIGISQVKEKFATLRVYWRGDVSPETAARIHEAIALAQARSGCTCEQCGAEGRLYSNAGVYMTRCTAHAKGAPVPVEPGQENVHLVRIPTAGGYRTAPRRYDREGDRFVDVPPSSPEIEEQ